MGCMPGLVHISYLSAEGAVEVHAEASGQASKNFPRYARIGAHRRHAMTFISVLVTNNALCLMSGLLSGI